VKILITGATGLIGKEIGRRLTGAGHEITAVARDVTRARRELPFPARIFAWPGMEAPFPLEALEGQEAVIHLAGEPIADGRWTDARKKRIRNSRVQGTNRLVEAILDRSGAASSLKTFVMGSAIGYYGSRGDEALTEESQKGKGFLADVTEAWELEAEALKIRNDVRVVKVRTGVVLSRRGGALVKMLPAFTLGLGGKLGHGQQWMSWIHIEDIARLFGFCVENENVQGVINGVAPEPARNDRFTIELARALGRSVGFPVSETVLKLGLGELATTILGSQRALPARAQELGFNFHFPELVGALRELGEPLRGGTHELVSEQWMPQKPEEIFPFFCDENNLEKLTPPILAFHVLGKNTPVIGEGTLIEYRLKIRGVPTKWRTRIELWKPNECFVDTQEAGPYRYWHHTHEFIPFAGGTLMRDRVLYRLPLGLLGEGLAGWLVSRDVEKVFSYRRQVIDTIFRKET
jgi:uncharacterized protein (TIGR01777 family)